MRMTAGLAVANCYSIIAVLKPASCVSCNLLALICCATILPLMLTRAEAPELPDAPRLRLRPGLAWAKSPLGAVGVVVSGISGATFRIVGPVYGLEVSFRPDQIALFLAAYVPGGASAQIPVGWLADKHDRRVVLIGLSVTAIAAASAMVALSGSGPVAVFATAAVFGFATLPVYSGTTAHAYDFAESHVRVELSAAHMFLHAVGTIASPYRPCSNPFGTELSSQDHALGFCPRCPPA